MTTAHYTYDDDGIARHADGRPVYLCSFGGGDPVRLDEDEIGRLIQTGLFEPSPELLATFKNLGRGAR